MPMPLIEAYDDNGTKKIRVNVIEAGLSQNRINYPANTLRRATPLFNTRVMVKSDDDHIKNKGKSVGNLHGQLTNARFVEGAGERKQGAIQADLELLDSAEHSQKITEAVDKGMTDLLGLSIDAVGHGVNKRGFVEAKTITKVNSVDVIIEPGAGGRFIQFVEAKKDAANSKANPEQQETSAMFLADLIEAVKEKDETLLEGVDLKDEKAVLRVYTEAVKSEAIASKHTPSEDSTEGQQSDSTETIMKQVDTAIKMVEARGYVRQSLASSKLPQQAKDKVQTHFDGQARFETKDVDKFIEAEGRYVAELTDEGKPNMPEFGAQYGDFPNGIQMLEAFFDPENNDVFSFKECYQDITGDRHCTGLMSDVSRTRFVEALDSNSLPNVLADVVHRRVLSIWANSEQQQRWRRVVRISNISDFKEHNITEWGGFGDLQAVAESGAYPMLSEPTDKNAKIQVSKRGGVAKITMEMIKNDDRDAINQIPMKMTRSADRTLSKFVWNFFLNNAQAPDGKALFHADHNNLFTGEISQAELLKHYQAMMQQPELDTGEWLEIEPRIALCSLLNEKDMYNLFRRDQNNDTTYEQNINVDIIRVPGWTTATDWGLVADPMDIANVEIGFLDGQQQPSIFTQDMPNVGSVFTNDETTLKIRHIYGGSAVDWRGATMAKVPG